MEKFEDIYIYDEQIKIIVLNNDTRERFHNMHFEHKIYFSSSQPTKTAQNTRYTIIEFWHTEIEN